MAFYEIAATLIPVLFLGGVVLDNLHPPDLKKLGERGVGRVVLFLVVYYLPALGLLVIFAEVIALDAVANRSADLFHALFVGITLLLGMVAVVTAVWVPWLIRWRGWAQQHLGQSLMFFLCTALAAAFLLPAALAFQPWAVIPFSDLLNAVKSPPHHRESRQYASERTWLEHLIATSGYRIDRLQEEKEHASSAAVRDRIARHIELQRRVQSREHSHLTSLMADGRAGAHLVAGP